MLFWSYFRRSRSGKEKIISRISEGRKKTVLNGCKFGRHLKISIDKFKVYYEKFLNREMTAKEIQDELVISK